ncbi:MAG: hypothetical protein NTU83_03790 [Candidatus Hydrogenedentes bacterium]|nr:hypothetical protein [Candidatus Hydrogenedentota bacterium]
MNLKRFHFDDINDHSDDINSIAITDDGRLAVTASYDRTLRVWDLEKRTALHILRGHTRSITAVATVCASHQAISASQDASLRRWNLDTGALEGVFTGHANEIVSVAVSPSGKQAASGAHDDTVRIWDLVSGKEQAVIDVRTLQGGKLTVDFKKLITTQIERFLPPKCSSAY